jgi:hypothetical protein
MNLMLLLLTLIRFFFSIFNFFFMKIFLFVQTKHWKNVCFSFFGNTSHCNSSLIFANVWTFFFCFFVSCTQDVNDRQVSIVINTMIVTELLKMFKRIQQNQKKKKKTSRWETRKFLFDRLLCCCAQQFSLRAFISKRTFALLKVLLLFLNAQLSSGVMNNSIVLIWVFLLLKKVLKNEKKDD